VFGISIWRFGALFGGDKPPKPPWLRNCYQGPILRKSGLHIPVWRGCTGTRRCILQEIEWVM